MLQFRAKLRSIAQMLLVSFRIEEASPQRSASFPATLGRSGSRNLLTGLVEFSLVGLKRRHRVNTEGQFELGDLLECQTLVLELIAKGESIHQVLDTLLRIIQLQCPGMLASILLLDDDGLHVRHGGAPDLPEAYMRAIDGLPIGPQAGSCGTAAFTRKPVVVGDIATDPIMERLSLYGPPARFAGLLVHSDLRFRAACAGDVCHVLPCAWPPQRDPSEIDRCLDAYCLHRDHQTSG